MRLATIIEHEHEVLVAVAPDRVLEIEPPTSMKAIAAAGIHDIRINVTRLTPDSDRGIDRVQWAPAVPDPGAIFTIGANYRAPGKPDASLRERPSVLAKLSSSVAGHGATVTWDRSLTANVDGECELGVVIGRQAFAIAPEHAMEHVFGYTIVNDMNSVDPWLDGDQWLLGKSLPGFCPVGPWVVTADDLDPADLRLGCMINGEPIQDGRTSDMRFSVAEIVAFLSRHVPLRPGDLIATGTPVRLAAPPGPDRHLQPGDIVTAWIEGIGELTTTIA